MGPGGRTAAAAESTVENGSTEPFLARLRATVLAGRSRGAPLAHSLRGRRQGRVGRGRVAADAVVWEALTARTSEDASLTGSFLAFLVIAVLIAGTGLALNSAILIVGAMVVGPDFGPIAGFCVAVVQRRAPIALRSFAALAVGFPVAIGVGVGIALLGGSTGLGPEDFTADGESLARTVSAAEGYAVLIGAARGDRRDALAEHGEVGGPDRGADLRHDHPGGGGDLRSPCRSPMETREGRSTRSSSISARCSWVGRSRWESSAAPTPGAGRMSSALPHELALETEAQTIEPRDDQTSILVRTRRMTSSVNSVVVAWPPRSGVRVPAAVASSTDS
jgi:Domain of unknown function (DUF389)